MYHRTPRPSMLAVVVTAFGVWSVGECIFCPPLGDADCSCGGKGGGWHLACPDGNNSLIQLRVTLTTVSFTCMSHTQHALDHARGLTFDKLGIRNVKFRNCPPPAANASYGQFFSSIGLSKPTSLMLRRFAEGGEVLKSEHLKDLETLKQLFLMESQSPYLAADLFSGLRSLTVLMISNNSLQSLPEGLFAPLPNLTGITLSEKRLKALDPGCFTNQTKLKLLHLDGNNLTSLPVSLFAGKRLLFRLSLRNNRLDRLEPSLLKNVKSVKTFYLNGNRLTAIAEPLFADCVRLEVLDLSRNLIDHLPDGIFRSTRKLKALYLQFNRLTTISESLFLHPTNLTMLNVRNNRLVEIHHRAFQTLRVLEVLTVQTNNLINTSWMVPLLNLSAKAIIVNNNSLTRLEDLTLEWLNRSRKLAHVGLENNPWICDCQTLPFTRFLHDNAKKLSKQKISCPNGKPVLEVNAVEVCPSPLLIGSVSGGCLAGLGIVTLGLLTVYFKYKDPLKIWLYAHRLCLCWVSERELDKDKKYDAFVSYARQDEEFVVNDLVPALEAEHGYKLCLHYRDWNVGEFISDQIYRSVEESRRTIVVLSSHFVTSVWGKMEFRVAHTQALAEGRIRVIVVVYQEPRPEQLLDCELKCYLKTNTYLKWDDPWFWQKLRYALPHRSCTSQMPQSSRRLSVDSDGSNPTQPLVT